MMGKRVGTDDKNGQCRNKNIVESIQRNLGQILRIFEDVFDALISSPWSFSTTSYH